MKTLTTQILEETAGLPEGQTICAKALLHLGERAAVDQALSRLARRGSLLRAERGFYVRPIVSRFGTRAPSPEKVVNSIASARGEKITEHGAIAANQFGLTTQVPMKEVFFTSGPSRHIRLGNQTVELKHAPPWQLTVPGAAGSIVRAIAWLGRERSRENLRALKKRLPAEPMQVLAQHRHQLPGWLAKEVAAA